MIHTYALQTESLRAALPTLEMGDRVLLSGVVYTARDAAHQRFVELLDSGKDLPFPVQDAVLYYAGPTPGQKGLAVGACGPTTASRMDAFAPRLLDCGLAGMIGKGARNASVKEAIRRNQAVYFAAVGGTGALIARCIQESRIVAFADLGCEAVRRLVVKDFPLTVAVDTQGHDLFLEGKKKYGHPVQKEKMEKATPL